ncbi:glycosyltransferase [Nocardioides sp. CER19]|uniref:glycosyltransferase n=1 Tax=Nocardioides sp. CER19 TaxID=3038538 RepID=UPI00244D54CF|nr:glycosyltransferase [Nocardioides sp. CER19]MDH2414173.1 glycosyltransferase [Nocardioides sp. CER19]
MPGVVLIVSQPGSAGVAHVVADHLRWAAAAGWRCVVACDPDSRLAALVEAGGAQVAPWRARRSPDGRVAGEITRLREILSGTAPDLLHLHSSKAGLVGRLAARGSRPTIFQPHSWSFQAVTGTRARLAVQWELLAQRWTSLTLCVSEAERLHGLQVGLAGTTVVLPNAVDAQRFHPVSRAAALARRRSLGLYPEDRPLAVCVGRVCRQKGQDLLLAAWPQVVQRVPGARLVIGGAGDLRWAAALPTPRDVCFVGALDDPVAWFQSADVVAVPSRWEGQPLVMLEAMACGVPVVASSIPPHVETLPRSAGAVVPAQDPTALADALVERLTGSGRARSAAEGRAGRAHVMSRHNPVKIGEELVRLYDDTAR